MNLLKESRLTLKLALPLVIGQVSQMLLGVADTLMIGRVGVTELAALTFANALFHLPLVFGIGLLTGISVFTSNACGRGDSAAARESCRHGLMVAVVLGVGLFALFWPVSLRLDWFRQPPEVTAATPVYLRIVMASLIPALASFALKNQADALNRPWPPFWIFLAGVVLNVVLNWVMIYGNLGGPALGFEGAAWATLISRTLIFAGMAWWLITCRDLAEWVPNRWFRRPRLPEIRRQLRIGVPASLQMLFEISAFSMAGLMMGGLGPGAMAAHQVAVTLAGTAFMVPLGISMALTVRIGEAAGTGDRGRLRAIAISGWGVVFAFACVMAAAFIGFGETMASWFTDSRELIAPTAALLLIVGVFQWVDGLQVASIGMLRGLEDARLPMIVGIFAYWGAALPVGWLLAFGAGWGARGIWWGLALGLGAAAAVLGPRLWRLTAPRD